MADHDGKGRSSLLDFAIVASLAVLPVLLAVLLAVAALRPADGAGGGDRHVSVRQLAALKTFEPAVVRRAAATGAPSAAQLLAQVPACRGEWGPRSGPLARLQSLLGRSAAPAGGTAMRLSEQLAEIDRALARFSSRDNRRVVEPVGLHAGRWLEAVARTLATPVEAAGHPGLPFVVRCDDIAAAVRTMAHAEGRLLESLAWRGTEVNRVTAAWRPEQWLAVSPRQLARANPWGGLAGCIYLGRSGDDATPAWFAASPRGTDERLCDRPEMSGLVAPAPGARGDKPLAAPRPLAGEPGAAVAIDDPRWSLPPTLGAMLAPLETLRRPSGELYRQLTEADADAPRLPGEPPRPNRIALDRHPLDVGFSIDLTIDPALQALSQKTAACYTGRQDACTALGIRRPEDGGRAVGSRMLESALVRMAAVAIIDVASGRIEALAGALSPCTRQEFDGPGRARNCDSRLPYPIRFRPDALLNPAAYHDAMPASTIKPIMASAFLADRQVGARWLAAERAAMAAGLPERGGLRSELMRSDSARFLDRMFCADQGFAGCNRPAAIQTAAQRFGWNGGCAGPRIDCGQHDLLFGRPVDAPLDTGVPGLRPLAGGVVFGRLLTEPVGGNFGSPFGLMNLAGLSAGAVGSCAAGADGQRGSGDDWEKCRGRPVVDVVAEGWGQGQARSSALGVAGMMASLAAAANGQSEARRPHLVRSIRGVADGRSGDAGRPAVLPWSTSGPAAPLPPRDGAEVILDALSYSHRAGTARLACEQVFDAARCRDIDWIAGKTGTPTFPNDGRSLAELAALCKPVSGKRRKPVACGPLRPYKWYTAAWRSDPADPRWTKVIGVLTERNWIAASGRIHGAGDQGPNPAAEIALQIAGRQRGAIAEARP